MTVIAYRDGVMASDTASYFGNIVSPRVRKLARGNDGVLYGVCGDGAASDAFLAWVKGGYQGPRPDPVKASDDGSNFEILIAERGKPLRMRHYDGESVFYGDYMAIGSGQPVALGALFSGSSAVMACQAAIAHYSHCGGQVETISFEAQDAATDA